MYYLKIYFKVLALLLLTVILAGCTYTVIPDKIPPLQGYKKVSDASVALVNAEKVDSEVLFFQSRNSEFYGNPRVWTENFIKALSRELTKCGISVTNNAPLKLNLAIQEISGRSSVSTGFTVKITAIFSSGWSKIYEGSAASTGNTRGRNARKAANFTLKEIIKSMLADSEFMEQLQS
jgi:uncharacterized lipoprotein YajG